MKEHKEWRNKTFVYARDIIPGKLQQMIYKILTPVATIQWISIE